MSDGIDFAAVNQAALASYPERLFGWFPSGRLKGREFEVGNLTGESGASLKINTETGVWKDFATGEGGSDPISLRAAQLQIGQGEAAKTIARELPGIPLDDASVRARRKSTPANRPASQSTAGKRGRHEKKWTPLHPRQPPPSKIEHPALWVPDHVYEYFSPDRELAFLICRWDARGKSRKKVFPFSYGVLEGTEGWHFKQSAPKRWLYNLPELLARSTTPILILEGEKTAAAAQRLVGDGYVITTWSGGTNAVHQSDWSFLSGRNVIIWPDNDEAGRNAAAKLLEILEKAGAATIDMVTPPKNASKGWDLADAEADGWKTSRVEQYLEKRKKAAAIELRSRQPNPSEPSLESHRHLRFLGYERDHFYILTTRGQQVIEITGRALRDRGNLIMLAPLDFWERTYPGSRGIDADRAADWLIKESFKARIYDPARQRGRGAWWDDNRAVLHLGDRLIVDGMSADISTIDSEFIYEASRALHYAEVEPLSDHDATELQQVCDMLLWERPLSGTLLAGWCVAALVAGALRWRPHIWITSPSGSGKSWVMDQIIRRTVGALALTAQSKSTEAGLRQEIKGDARPVLFDEAEGEDPRARARMQAIIELARACSSEDGGDLYKGTPSGAGKRYSARCCFAFSSVNVQLRHLADENRITVLSLLPPTNETDPEVLQRNIEHFEKLQARAGKLLTGDFSARLLTRAMRCLPVIVKNVETFSLAITARLGNRRLGDQIGTLLAGDYVLRSTGLVSPDEARGFVDTLDLSEHIPAPDEQDEQRLLSKLLEHVTRVQTDKGLATDRAVGELINMALGKADTDVSSDAADMQLKRIGFRVDRDAKILFVSNNHATIARILVETPWATNWRRTLKRLPGTMSQKHPIWFAGSSKSRATGIPLSLILKGDD